MHSLLKDKILGLDGWLVEFFASFLNPFEKYLLKFIEESMENGIYLASFNFTFIALIPKFDSSSNIDDYRLISLCNCIYKFIAKVIASRVKEIRSTLISQEQFSFMVGKQIHITIGTAQEVLHTVKTKELPAMIIKVDLSKSYYIVNQLYLRLGLLQVGFHL